MRTVFEKVIDKGGFDLSSMLYKIDSYHIDGRLTDADREALCKKARAKANAKDSVDVLAKLADLEERVRRLENGETEGGESTTETAPDYVAGKWYYAGDKISFSGGNYTCIAPEGVACVWSPAEYPAYWEQIE